MLKHMLKTCKNIRLGTTAGYTIVTDWDHPIHPIKETNMLSSRTITFLAVAVLIVAAIFATTSMLVGLPSSDLEQPKAASNAQGLAQYHQSERAGQSTAMGLAQYHRSEWDVYESTENAGLAIYFESERNTPIGSADPFDMLKHEGPGR